MSDYVYAASSGASEINDFNTSWTNVNNSISNDSTYATNLMAQFEITNRLDSIGYHITFSGISDAATIDGFHVEYEGLADNANAIKIYTLEIYGATVTSTYTPSGWGYVPTTESAFYGGGPTDLGSVSGGTWTGAEVKSSAFTVRTSFTNDEGIDTTISIDRVWLYVYYTEPAIGGGRLAMMRGGIM